jgi:hypothetical protein
MSGHLIQKIGATVTKGENRGTGYKEFNLVRLRTGCQRFLKPEYAEDLATQYPAPRYRVCQRLRAALNFICWAGQWAFVCPVRHQC